jgi:hypothetical protein
MTIAIGLGATLPDAAPETDPLAAMQRPRYDDAGLLLRPEGHREWVFVGATLGPTNFNGDPGPDPGYFHHIYMQPEAYRHYRAHGEFPEGTMMAMENFVPAPKEGTTIKGYLQHEFLGLEVAVKDHARFSEGWAYYDFSDYGNRTQDKALAQWFCFRCHNEQAGDDNVFVEFYPALRDVKNIEPELHPDFHRRKPVETTAP